MYNFEEIQKNGRDTLQYIIERKGQYSKTLKYESLKNLVPFDTHIDWKNIEEAFPHWVQRMKETPQDNFYHSEGDVWTHTKMVVEQLLQSSEFSTLSLFDKEVMFWSCLFHDISKPSVTCLNPDSGRISSAGHSPMGMQDSRLLMWVAGFDPVMRENIARIIQHHQKPFVWIKKARDFDIRKISQSVKMSNLVLMAQSDGLGRKTADIRDYHDIQTNVALFKEACLENDCLNKPWSYDFENLEARRIYWDSNGESHESREVFAKEGSEIIFFVGLPASGKDTWISKYGEGKEVLSYDDMKKSLGLKQSSNYGLAVQKVKERAKELLRNGEPFIWNATHLSPLMRDKNLNLIRQYLGQVGGTVRIVCFENDIDTLISRNSQRDTSLKDNKILQMAYGWEVPSPELGHELLWWKDNKPFYEQFITSEKDPNSPWLFAKPNQVFKR